VIGARLAGGSMINTLTLFSVSRATVSKVMSVYKNHGKVTPANNTVDEI
jgi:hypothetical protein